MNNAQSIKLIIHAIIFLLIQVVMAQELVLFNVAFCFIYLGFILLFPLYISRINLMLLAVFLGFIVDLFNNSLGSHMAAATFLAFIRPLWVNAITPRGGYENVEYPGIKDISLGWFLLYALPLIFIYSFIWFFIEAGTFSLFFLVLAKVIGTSIFTTLVLVLIQYLFYSKSRFA